MHKKAYRGQIGGCQRWVMGVGEMSKKGGQKVQTSSYKIHKSWGCNVQHVVTLVNNTVSYI